MTQHVTRVGAPDPERKTSPIIDEFEDLSLDQELESGACYFNDVPYPRGEFLQTGDELLQCDEQGVWVRQGETEPD